MLFKKLLPTDWVLLNALPFAFSKFLTLANLNALSSLVLTGVMILSGLISVVINIKKFKAL